MTVEDFRRIALSVDGAVESSHMRHPDFRIRGKIFATLAYPSVGWGMIKLTPGQQRTFIVTDPAGFVPVKGAWGEKGCTNVRLASARENLVEEAMAAACGNIPEQTVRARARSKKRT